MDVKVPGVMAMLVAPDVVQLSVLLDPEVIVVGLAVKELTAGLLTVTVTVDVVEPVALVAVSVYVVVVVGLTDVEPVADVEVNVPGVMAILVAPETIQLRELLEPEVMLVGSAVKEAMVGAEPLTAGGVVEPQPVSPTAISRRMATNAP